jgi:hypothetical protein
MFLFHSVTRTGLLIFQMILPTRVVIIASLVIDREYPIIWVQRTCDWLLFSFQGDFPDYESQVYVPHTSMYSDGDIEDMNINNHCYSLAYRAYIGFSRYNLSDQMRERPGSRR